MITREEYEAKREARYWRLCAAADRAAQESAASYKSSDQMASVIPFGQPILVGHHSERADRNYRERIHQKMRKGWELREKSERLRARVEATKNCRAIFSDDPDATTKIEDRIAKLEKRQEFMKQVNKLIRKNDRAALLDLGLSEQMVEKLFAPDFCGRVGFPDYALTNNGANIRRLKQRLPRIEQLASLETSEIAIGDIRIVQNADINRLQIFFPGKPDAAVRSELKHCGFRWAPSEGAWQRMISTNATYYAKQIVNKYYGS